MTEIQKGSSSLEELNLYFGIKLSVIIQLDVIANKQDEILADTKFSFQ